MVNIKISIHNRNLDAKKENLKKWKIPDEEKKSLLKFLSDLSLGKVNKGKRVSENRQLKYLEILKIPLEFFNKSTKKLTLKDMEDFEKKLISNKILSKFKNKPFSDATKSDINTALRCYLRWRRLSPKLYDWVDTRVPKKTPDYLSEQEITKLYKTCKNSAERFLIAVLFDAGCRAEEFHNIRKEDIQLPTGSDTFVKLTLKEEYSKTKGRVISLYWKYSLEAVRDYLNERLEIKNDEPIFLNSYDNSRQVLMRLGIKAINKKIHYHLFRHSSATYYANKLNRQELCYRYGWAFSSDMPDVYISRAGMNSKQLDENFKSTELEEVKREFDKEKLKKDLELDRIKKLMSLIFKQQGILEEDFEDLDIEQQTKNLS